MKFRNGKIYTVQQLAKSHYYWNNIQAAINRRTKPGMGSFKLKELYSVKWKRKPFPWSYSKEFKPHRRWFYHGTTQQTIINILDGGFKVSPVYTAKNGRMLGDGVYATYHTNKGKMYGVDGYVVSVMVYAPNTLVFHPSQQLDKNTIDNASQKYDAIEVRTDVVINGWKMVNHEICVFDTRRVIPRFIIKI
jgi:hypothetical protein